MITFGLNTDVQRHKSSRSSPSFLQDRRSLWVDWLQETPCYLRFAIRVVGLPSSFLLRRHRRSYTTTRIQICLECFLVKSERWSMREVTCVARLKLDPCGKECCVSGTESFLGMRKRIAAYLRFWSWITNWKRNTAQSYDSAILSRCLWRHFWSRKPTRQWIGNHNELALFMTRGDWPLEITNQSEFFE